MKRKLSLLILILPVLVGAQPYTVKQLSLEKGLSNNFVVSIAQDKEGFLWFATDEGLNRFDGSHFITYYKEEGTQRASPAMNCIVYSTIRLILFYGLARNVRD